MHKLRCPNVHSAESTSTTMESENLSQIRIIFSPQTPGMIIDLYKKDVALNSFPKIPRKETIRIMFSGLKRLRERTGDIAHAPFSLKS